MSDLKVNSIDSLNGVDEVSIPTLDKRMAKAWINFDGTGTVSIKNSYNVSGIIDNGVGSYTVYLENPVSVDSSLLITSNSITNNQKCDGGNITSSTSLDISTRLNNAAFDATVVSAAIY